MRTGKRAPKPDPTAMTSDLLIMTVLTVSAITGNATLTSDFALTPSAPASTGTSSTNLRLAATATASAGRHTTRPAAWPGMTARARCCPALYRAGSSRQTQWTCRHGDGSLTSPAARTATPTCTRRSTPPTICTRVSRPRRGYRPAHDEGPRAALLDGEVANPTRGPVGLPPPYLTYCDTTNNVINPPHGIGRIGT
jgi:hypothetical protein